MLCINPTTRTDWHAKMTTWLVDCQLGIYMQLPSKEMGSSTATAGQYNKCATATSCVYHNRADCHLKQHNSPSTQATHNPWCFAGQACNYNILNSSTSHYHVQRQCCCATCTVHMPMLLAKAVSDYIQPTNTKATLLQATQPSQHDDLLQPHVAGRLPLPGFCNVPMLLQLQQKSA